MPYLGTVSITLYISSHWEALATLSSISLVPILQIKPGTRRQTALRQPSQQPPWTVTGASERFDRENPNGTPYWTMQLSHRRESLWNFLLAGSGHGGKLGQADRDGGS